MVKMRYDAANKIVNSIIFNMSGNETLQLYFIGKTIKPVCFKIMKTLLWTIVV